MFEEDIRPMTDGVVKIHLDLCGVYYSAVEKMLFCCSKSNNLALVDIFGDLKFPLIQNMIRRGLRFRFKTGKHCSVISKNLDYRTEPANGRDGLFSFLV